MSTSPRINDSLTDLPNSQLLDMIINMQAILNHSTECYVLVSLDGTMRMINPSAKRMIFSNVGSISQEGQNFFDYLETERRQLFLGFIDEVAKGNSISYTREIIQTDRTPTWIEFLLSPVVEKGEITAACIRARDVTSVRREVMLQDALNMEKDEKKQQLAKAAIQAQEQQRAETGKELHDNINQMLASVRVLLQYSLTHEAERKKNIEKSIGVLDDCTEEIRQLSKRLVPPSLGDLGLKAAITDLFQTVAMSGIKVQASGLSKINERALSAELKLTLYRILQEQVSNILKHAQASLVVLGMKKKGKQLIVELTDNGKGFDVQGHRKGIGLHNIFNRAAVYQAQVDLQSVIGNGTSMRVTFDVND
ncbi:MAG: PAS domain-containing protein [Flavitalea sp.]